MNLTVHIGTTKTGTSSIQAFLHHNQQALRQDGILVPNGLGHLIHFHTAIAALPFGKSPDLAKLIPLGDVADHARFREETRNSFYEQLAAAPDCREVIITAEQLHSRLTLPEDVQSFRDLFCSGFDKVRIVVYIRPQLDQIISLYSTMLRGGYAHTLESFITARLQPRFRPYFDLRDVITRWSDLFGTENVTVRPYKAISGQFGTLGDFCSLMDIDLAQDGWELHQPANGSINIAGQELLRMLNQSGALDAAKRRQIVKWAETHCAGHGALPTLQQARDFQSLFDESNAWVTQTFFPDHPDYLEPRWPEA